jgi:transketolase
VAELIRETYGEPVMMRKTYGDALVALGRAREDVVALSADVANSDFSNLFEAAFPDRFFNVGIAEPAMVDIAVGLSKNGFVPFCNTFAFLFATRALEMVRTHLSYGQTNVKLAATYAGLSDSFDGPTHQEITDLAIMRALPHMTVIVPADGLSVERLLPLAAAHHGPVYFRLCRNEVPGIYTDAFQPEIGKGVVIREGGDLTIIGCGVMLARCLEAAHLLEVEGVQARVVDMHTIKPMDRELVLRCAAETGAIVTVEEHSIVGGLGGAVAEITAGALPVPVVRVGVPDVFAETGPYTDLLDNYGLAVADIMDAARRALQARAGALAPAGQESE